MKAEEFGKYIKDLRNEQKLTTRQLEKQSGVSNAYISQIENGKRIPTPTILQKLAPSLNITYKELMQAAGHLPLERKIETLTHEQYIALIKTLAEIALPHLQETEEFSTTEFYQKIFETLALTNGKVSPHQIEIIKSLISDIEILNENELVVHSNLSPIVAAATSSRELLPADISPEDIELIRKLKKLPPKKRKAIEILAETDDNTKEAD
ncbi:helix-turn-helix domain-containing protein [Sporomusa termitida]|uniref:Helix-turn-helix protein n=1 Tax=Sporomusa termitida TaxID=2377 RepID=A0A517DSC7_9FIRM|nr:helix-turn-helix transcriptional regulator [Sporomusa termitida]QDR80249.1 helix-turn-helix protein [Sporomusa termitida]